MPVDRKPDQNPDIEKNPNPQGKGLVPVLEQWQASQPLAAKAKNPGQLYVDYFVSLLVLSARFSFKPVRGQRYYLYLKNNKWLLSLVEPSAWHSESPGDYLGQCRLQDDMTWNLEPDAKFHDNPLIVEALGRFHQGLLEYLDDGRTLKEKLPWFAEKLPFYQRMAANGLAKSIAMSASTEILENSASQWLEQLPQANLLELG